MEADHTSESPQVESSNDSPQVRRQLESSLKELKTLPRHLVSEMRQDEISRQNTRKRVTEEIVATERTYVENLRYLLNEYLNPLNQMIKDNQELVGKNSSVSFTGITIICKLHEDLLQQLQARFVDWDATQSKIGDVLLNIAPYLKVYTAYINSYEETLKYLSNLQQNKKFAAFFQSRKAPSEDIRGDWYLSQLLILPVQRIPRYELLLKELIKHTAPDHVDYEDLKEAKRVISEVAQYVNHTKSQLESRQRLWHLHTKLQFDAQAKKRDKLISLVKPSRNIIKEGTVRKMIKGQEASCLVVLFNDALLLAEIADEQLKFIGMISLFEATTKSIGPISIPTNLAVVGMPNIQDFHMNQVLVKSKEGVAITFYVNDDQEMRHWTEEIDAQAKLYTESKRKYAESMPMAQACKSNDAATLRQLLTAQPTAVNTPDTKGRTLLYFAAKKGHMEIAKLLVEEFGADVTHCTDQRYKPIEIARMSGFDHIVEYLEAKEPNPGEEKKKEKSFRKRLSQDMKIGQAISKRNADKEKKDRIDKKDKDKGNDPSDAHTAFTRGLPNELQKALRNRAGTPFPMSPNSGPATLNATMSALNISPSPASSPGSPSTSSEILDVLTGRVLASTTVSAYSTLRAQRDNARTTVQNAFNPLSQSLPNSTTTSSTLVSSDPMAGDAKKALRPGAGLLALRNKYTGPPPPDYLLARIELYQAFDAKKAEIEYYKAVIRKVEEEQEQIRTLIESTSVPAKKAKIVHNYIARHKDELEGSAGEVINVEINDLDADRAWFLGKKDGQVGLVLGAWIEVTDDPGEPILSPRLSSRPPSYPLPALPPSATSKPLGESEAYVSETPTPMALPSQAALIPVPIAVLDCSSGESTDSKEEGGTELRHSSRDDRGSRRSPERGKRNSVDDSLVPPERKRRSPSPGRSANRRSAEVKYSDRLELPEDHRKPSSDHRRRDDERRSSDHRSSSSRSDDRRTSDEAHNHHRSFDDRRATYEHRRAGDDHHRRPDESRRSSNDRSISRSSEDRHASSKASSSSSSSPSGEERRAEEKQRAASGVPAATSARGGGLARATQQFTARRRDEIDLEVGDLIIIHRRSGSGWWEGTISASGRKGVFPSKCVHELDLPPPPPALSLPPPSSDPAQP